MSRPAPILQEQINEILLNFTQEDAPYDIFSDDLTLNLTEEGELLRSILESFRDDATKTDAQKQQILALIQANPNFFVGFVNDLIANNANEDERQQKIADFIENFVEFRAAMILQGASRRNQEVVEAAQNAAATRIQEAVRGYLERRHEDNEVNRAAATRIQAAFRGNKVRQQLKEEKQTAAATKIQGAFRGYLERKRLKEGKLPNQLLNPENPNEDDAARKIQRAWRDSKLRKTKEVDRLAGMLEEGFPQIHDRQTLIDQELFGKTQGKSYVLQADEKGKAEFVEVRTKDQERLKSDLTYSISGYSRENPAKSKLYKQDNITLEATGLSFTTFDIDNGGLSILQRQIDKARLIASKQTDPEFSSFVLVRMEGDLRRPLLDQNGGIIYDQVPLLDEKGNPKVDEKGQAITIRQARTVVEVETPYSIIHQKGTNVSQSFVKPVVIEKMTQDLEQKMEARKRIMLRVAIEQFKDEPASAEKDAKILAVVRSSLRVESEKAFEQELQKSRDLASLHYENSREAIEKLRVEHQKRFESQQSQKFLREMGKVDDPKGPGITINKDATGYNVKVSFFREKPQDEIFDIAYIAIPGGGNVRVQTALKDGVVTRYVDGQKQEVKVKAGEVVMDENTLVYFNENTKSYQPVKVLEKNWRGASQPSKEMKQFFRVGNDATFISESYSKMNIEAISILGPDLSIAIQRNGKRQTLSSTMPKVANQGENEEKLVLRRKVPSKASFANRGFEIDGHRAGDPVTTKIPQFDLSIFQVEETVQPGIIGRAITNPALKTKEELKFLQEKAANNLRIQYKQADKTTGIQIRNVSVSGFVGVPGRIIEVKAGEFYFAGIVDAQGNPVPKHAIIQEYGQKFYDTLVRTELGIVRKDEIKEQEQQFRKAAEMGDVATVKKMIASYQERLQEAIALVNFSRGDFEYLTLEEQKALKAKMVAEIMANSAPNIFADNGSVLKGQKNALHLAAANGHGEVVLALLEAGFDPSVRSTLKASSQQDGRVMNAFEMAQKAGFTDEARYTWLVELKKAIAPNYQDQPAQQRELAYFQTELERTTAITQSPQAQALGELEAQQEKFITAIKNSDEKAIDKFFEQYQKREKDLDSLIRQMQENGREVSNKEKEEIHKNYNFDRDLILGALKDALAARTPAATSVSSTTPSPNVEKPSAQRLQDMIRALGGEVSAGASRG